MRTFILTICTVFLTIAAGRDATALDLNHAAAFGWRGYADTDLAFSEFYAGDHTVMVRFMAQYPEAYTAPLLSVQGTGQYFVAKVYDAPRLQVNLGGTVETLDLPNPLQAGVWYHLAIVRSGTSFTFYLNGTQICLACTVSAGPSAPNGTLRLGRLADGATDQNHETQYYGLIDDVAVFDSALTQSQIATIVGAPRLTGSESDLLAGYTFDDEIPGGGPLPPSLSRPVDFLTVTPGPVMPGQPSYVTLVSALRDNNIDVLFLPPPFQQTSLRLPFPPGEAWEVSQGWENSSISHHGPAAFAWDFILAGQPVGNTDGAPIYATTPGTVVETRNDRDSCAGYPASYVMIEQAPVEIGAYLHFTKGSVAVADNQTVFAGDYLATASDTGNSCCGCYHLHYALHTHPESQAAVVVTFPGAFSNYEVSTDGGQSWQYVDRGIPVEGEWVRRGPNQPPVCDANGSYVAECMAGSGIVQLDGTGSSDPDGDRLTYSWTTDCGGGSLDDATSDSPTLTADGPLPCPVSCTASLTVEDPDGLSDSCYADVTIQDTTPPMLTVPPPIVVECSAPGGTPASNPAIVDWLALAGAVDGCGQATLTHDAPSFFHSACPPGMVTVVTFTATDECGLTTTATSTVTIVDSAPPVIDAQPMLGGGNCALLWPPAHGYADFTVADTGISAHDICDGVSFAFTTCHSSQPEDASGTGDGESLRDCVIAPDGQTASTRAERNGACVALDRTYNMAIDAIDECGNATTSDPLSLCVYHDTGNSPYTGAPVYSANPSSNQSESRPGTNGTYGVDCGAGCSLACDPTQVR